MSIPKFYQDHLMLFKVSDAKLQALHHGLKNYYETYHIWAHRNSFYNYLFKANSKVHLSKAQGDNFLTHYYASISFVHLFFEYFLIEILEDINPILSIGKLKDETKFIHFLNTDLIKFNSTKARTLVFSILLARIKKLIIETKSHSIPPNFQINPKFHFLEKHLDSIKTLSWLRNDIIHSGKYLLNRYAYEVLFANKILPIIRQSIDCLLGIDKRPIERNLACGLNVISKIIERPLEEDYMDVSKFDAITKTLNRINHFKELGRASYLNELNMFENIPDEQQKKSMKDNDYYRRKKVYEMLVQVPLAQDKLGHYVAYNCPCCGIHCLSTVFDDFTYIEEPKRRLKMAMCIACGYEIGSELGEPKEWGIMNVELFKNILQEYN